MSEKDLEMFNKYQYLFDIFQRYFRFDVNKGFIPIYESIREKFLKYKPYYEFYTKDYRTNSSFINMRLMNLFHQMNLKFLRNKQIFQILKKKL